MGVQDGQQNSSGASSQVERAPASMVPFLQAPCSRGLAGPSSNGSSKGGPGGGSGLSDKVGPVGGLAGGSPSAKQAGSGGSQSPDIVAEVLAQLALRDWELNLDALEVSAAFHAHHGSPSLGCSTLDTCWS